MSERDDALAQIAGLAEQFALTPDDLRRALDARKPGSVKPRQGVLARLFAYIGGTLVLAGLCVFVATLWSGMNSAERVVVTLGSGLAALLLSYMASLSPQRERLVTPLFLISAFTQPLGLAVALQEFSSGGDERLGALAVCGVMTLSCLLFFVRVRRSSVLFFTLVFGGLAVSSALALLDVDEEWIALVLGVSLFLVTVAIAKSEHEAITPLWFFIATSLVLGAWFSLVERSVIEISEVVLIAAVVYLSTILRSRTLLATGTLALLVYLGYFSGRYFADSLGWPLLLIGLGVVMMGIGTVAVRIHRRYIKNAT